MTRLTDTQLVLLSTASDRPDGCIFPPAASVTASAEHIRRAVEALIRKQFVQEFETEDEGCGWRRNGNTTFRVAISDAGRAALALVPPGEAAGSRSEPVSTFDILLAPVTHAPPRPSKIAMVLDLLRRAEGANLPELVDATGWLPHSMRAALTGLRKKGHAIERGSRDGTTTYTLASL
jgi:hypothetical protein